MANSVNHLLVEPPEPEGSATPSHAAGNLAIGCQESILENTVFPDNIGFVEAQPLVAAPRETTSASSAAPPWSPGAAFPCHPSAVASFTGTNSKKVANLRSRFRCTEEERKSRRTDMASSAVDGALSGSPI